MTITWPDIKYGISRGLPTINGIAYQPGGAKSPPFRHKEAYCLMRYQAVVRPGAFPTSGPPLDSRARLLHARGEPVGDVETIWNARDGVTPFCVNSTGGELQHIDWNMDTFAPDFVPPVGSRVFVDYAIDMARRSRTAQLAHAEYGAHLRERFPHDTDEDIVEMLAKVDMEQPGQPGIVIVTDPWTNPHAGIDLEKAIMFLEEQCRWHHKIGSGRFA